MRYLSLPVVLLSLLLAAPAGAAQWPDGAKDEFMRECLAGAKVRHSEGAARNYCECAAGKVSAELSQDEMQQLQGKGEISREMQDRLVTVSSGCLSKLNQQ